MEKITQNPAMQAIKDIVKDALVDELVLHIVYSELNDGYMYDWYENAQAMEDGDSLDGGLCTGSIRDAVGMAMQCSLPIKK